MKDQQYIAGLTVKLIKSSERHELSFVLKDQMILCSLCRLSGKELRKDLVTMLLCEVQERISWAWIQKSLTTQKIISKAQEIIKPDYRLSQDTGKLLTITISVYNDLQRPLPEQPPNRFTYPLVAMDETWIYQSKSNLFIV
uniref:Uncharacterized protein n=1 Tax=Glossina pallidipes TaxID=7398 RepID=A0A1A9ZBK9_GLOPL